MIGLPDDWKKIQVPLGLVVLSGVIAVGAYGWATSTFVQAADYRQDQYYLRDGMLQQEQRRLELRETMLSAKEIHAPQKFTREDEIELNQIKKQLNEIKQQRRELKERK